MGLRLRLMWNGCLHLKTTVSPRYLLPSAALQTQIRAWHNKSYDPKWRKLRAAKVIKMELPDFQKLHREANMAPDEMRAEMKRLGRQPPRTFQERNIIIASTGSIFEAYVPPEGDGIASPISGKGAKQRLTEIEKKGKSLLQVRKIRKFDEAFDTTEFAQQALDIYIEAHQLLENIKQNEDRLHELVTEKAYPDMTWKLEKQSFRWKYIESLEPPRVVHVRTTEMISKENLYAQVTVRLLTRQTLAIYDRFGRLAYGSEKLAKDVLEYVVYEKHIADEYGQWRLHGKIIPDWLPQQQPVIRTMRQPDFGAVSEDDVMQPTDSSITPSTSSDNVATA
jgi:large subunit ribosomal protein L45